MKKNDSEIRQIVTPEYLDKAFSIFIEQADKNAISGKAHGTKAPYGFSKKLELDGGDFGLHYGQGSASATPYMNWWVVSIYYIPDSRQIFVGIEENRYSHIKDINIDPIASIKLGNKMENVIVFYSTSSENLEYKDLHNNFINVCEEVMRLGLR